MDSGRMKIAEGKKKFRYLRKHRRFRVDGYLLRALPPTPYVLQALEIAKAAAAEGAKEAEEAEEESSRTELDPLRSWDCLQNRFLKEHGDQIRQELGGSDVRLDPVHPMCSVQDDFLGSCRAVGGMPLPAYHGTRARNIPSIVSKGLIIPGRCGVRVEHGSAHGLGIYTATMGSSYLSRGFCDSDKMFICGVCDGPADYADPARPGHVLTKWTHGMGLQHRQHRPPIGRTPARKNAPQMMGRLPLHKESTFVRHVGSAMVVFDEARVAPLFLASGIGIRPVAGMRPFPNGSIVSMWWPSAGNPNHVGRPKWVGRRQTWVVQVGQEQEGEIVWLPPQREDAKAYMNKKRRFERKRWKQIRCLERREKFEKG